MMQYKRYDRYKDSGVEWIGEVPEGWELNRIGQLYEFINEKVSDEEFPPLSVTKDGIVPQLENVAKTIHGDNRKKVTVGDFVINSRADRPGSCGVSNFNGSVSMICHVMRPKNRKICREFGHHLFRNNRFSQEFYRWGRGIVDDLWTTRQDEMKKIVVVVPSTKEQLSIAEFLDQKTAEIDLLIADKEKLIALLEEQRQAIITEAVTKGLNPNVKMKDSGVEWIREIPEHWEVVKLKHALSKIEYGISESANYEGEYKLLTMGNIKNGEIEVPNEGVLDEVDKRYLLNKNDLLFNRTNSLDQIAKVGIFRGTIEDKVTFASYLVRLKVNTNVDSEYLHYQLNCSLFLQYARSFSIPSINQANLNANRYTNLPIILPPLEEQIKIRESIHKQNKYINDVVAEITNQIFKLKEYRQSLIYEAVTGKIDVRNAAAETIITA